MAALEQFASKLVQRSCGADTLLLVARSPRPLLVSRRSRSRRGRAHRHATEARGGSDQHPDREMFVADRGTVGPSSATGTLRVAPPRTAPSAPVQQDSRGMPDALMRLSAAGSKNLRAELSVASAELRDKAGALSQAQVALRAKDKEVALLCAAVAERDLRLRESKGELMGVRMELHAKEGQLRAAYDCLAEGARERAEVRAALVATQAELAFARAELEAWVQAGLPGLHAAVDGTGQDSAAWGGRDDAAATQTDEDSQTLDLLRELAALSAQVLADAQQDELLFQQESEDD